MQIPFLPFLNSTNLKTTSEQLNKTDFFRIGCNNWPEQFPYTPSVLCTLAHNGSTLFVKFRVEEATTKAQVCEDNGKVWTDSCVELFISVDDSGYYNFEFSCIGKTLLGFRKERPQAVYASAELLNTIPRYSSLGKENFEEKQIPHPWELTVGIPISALFKHHLTTWQGLEARINLYKCGDQLSQPHYLSWRPIDTPKPDFHTPRYFTKVRF